MPNVVISFSVSRYCFRCIAAIIGSIGLASIVVGQETANPSSNDAEVIHAYLGEYRSNRDSFARFVCRFELRRFEGCLRSEMILGRVSPVDVAEGVWSKGRGKERREVFVSEERIAEALKTGHIAFDPQIQLLFADEGVYFARDMNSGVLYSSRAPANEKVIGPFSWGLFSSRGGGTNFDMPNKVSSGELEMRVVTEPVDSEPQAAVPAAELVGIEYAKKSNTGKVSKWRYYISPKHGCLPIIAQKFDSDQLTESALVTDIREFSEGRYFPIRNLHTHHSPDDKSRVFWAIETKVTALDVDIEPDETLFEMTIPKGAVLRDLADDNSQVRFTAERKVTTEDFGELFQLTANQAAKQIEYDAKNRESVVSSKPPVPVNSRSNRMPIVLMVNLALIVIVSAAIWISVRRRAANK